MRLLKNLIIEVNKVKSRLNARAGQPLFEEFPSDFEASTIKLVNAVEAYTMTSRERILGLESAVRYLVRGGIAGAFVECGVWRGGSMMAMALTLLDEGAAERELFLCDTYEGMPEPSAEDIGVTGKSAHPTWKKRLADGKSQWCRAGIEEVRANLSSTGYDGARMHFLKGRVQDTLPDDRIGPIALLRLDTDWYDSTKWELEQLYPQLATGGVLIIDDYGRWQGCRKAVDEYFAAQGINMLLGRIDSYARMGIKT
ncbi:MAG: class I SAM-dependent methyltransferase [Proteobacteria bacterium]|nr:class I SAM-dependent methyltransferase [Pseudomonadota bacterium]